MKLILAAALAMVIAGACSPSPVMKTATVTDQSVPFAASEADALVPRGLLGNADFGRLAVGCTVEVIKATDRAAFVRVLQCPRPDTMPTELRGAQGWVAKSALSVTSP